MIGRAALRGLGNGRPASTRRSGNGHLGFSLAFRLGRSAHRTSRINNGHRRAGADQSMTGKYRLLLAVPRSRSARHQSYSPLPRASVSRDWRVRAFRGHSPSKEECPLLECRNRIEFVDSYFGRGLGPRPLSRNVAVRVSSARTLPFGLNGFGAPPVFVETEHREAPWTGSGHVRAIR